MIDTNTQNLLRASVESNEKYPIRLTEVWESLGYKQYRSVTNKLKRALKEGKDYVDVSLALQRTNSNPGQSKHEYRVTGNAFKHLAMASETEAGYACREYYITIEEAAIERTRALLTQTFTAEPITVAPPEPLYTLEQAQAVVNFHSLGYLRSVIADSLTLGTHWIKWPDKSISISQDGLNVLGLHCRSAQGTNFDLLPAEIQVKGKEIAQARDDSKMNRRRGRRFKPEVPGQLPLF